MSEQKRPTPGSGSCAQVWEQPGADRQTQVIRLMAQLAINWLMVQFDGAEKEAYDVKPTGRAQSPT
jgi:hypothetical protein